MKINNSGNDKGFILITVMVLTLMASTVVLTSLQDTTVQERLSGNFQKKMNSRMMAEKGVFDALNEMNATIATEYEAGSTLEETLEKMQVEDMSGGQETGNNSDSGSYNVNVDADTGVSEVTIKSAGALYEGETQLQGVFQLIAGQTDFPSFPYAPGVTSCRSMEVGASGSIDSYNSLLGEYGEPDDNGDINIGNDVTVQTLIGGSAGGSIDLSGGGVIQGNLLSANDLNISGGLQVSGDVRGKGNMTLTGHNTIGGSVFMKGYYDQRGSGAIGGDIYANGYVYLNQINLTGGDVTSLGALTVIGGSNEGSLLSKANITLQQVNVSGDATAHGTISFQGHNLGSAHAGGNIEHYYGSIVEQFANVDLSTLPLVPELTDDYFVDPSSIGTGSGTCDEKDIKSQVAEVNNANRDLNDFIIADTSSYYLSNSEVSESDKVGAATYFYPTESATFMGSTYQMFMYNDVTLRGDLSIVPGEHITLYVEGDFSMVNSPSLTIPEESSLTIIIKGTLTIEQNYVNTPIAGVTTSGKPVLSIFSAYNSIEEETPEAGVKFTNGLDDIYAVIYAPLSKVIIESGVNFSGSIYGYDVDISGAGEVHYDTALEDATLEPIPPSARYPSVIFKGWKYVTDEDESESDS